MNQHDAANQPTQMEGYLPVPYDLKKYNFINKVMKKCNKKIAIRED